MLVQFQGTTTVTDLPYSVCVSASGAIQILQSAVYTEVVHIYAYIALHTNHNITKRNLCLIIQVALDTYPVAI
jgi:hypothetical protein